MITLSMTYIKWIRLLYKGMFLRRGTLSPLYYLKNKDLMRNTNHDNYPLSW